MRDAIDQYYADKNQYPSTLDALVSDGTCANCPTTRSPRTAAAAEHFRRTRPNNPIAEPGVYDVKSGADGTALDGTKYSEV